MGRPSLRGVFAVFVVLVAGWHLIAVTAAAIPPNRYSSAVEGGTTYLSPYFTQNWRLFAPNPVAEDRNMRFQAAYRDEAGEIQQTEWVDWTSVELDVVHHRIIGGRGGYVTNKMIESLSTASRRLTSAQRNLLLNGTDENPPTWEALADTLKGGGVEPGRIRSVLRYEQAAARLATDVMRVRNPDLDIVAVRYSIQLSPVIRYAARNDEGAKRSTRERISGWRTPVKGSKAELKVIADFDARHR